MGVVDLSQGVGGETRGRYYLAVSAFVIFSLVLLLFVLSYLLSLS